MKSIRPLLLAIALFSFSLAAPPAEASDLLVTGDNTGTVFRYDGETGNFIEEFVPTGSGGLSRPDGITFTPEGSLLVLDLAVDQILEYNGLNGDFIGTFGPVGPSGDCVDVGPDGNIFVCDFDGDQVFRLDSAGNGGPFLTGIDGPEGLTFDSEGNIYVTSCNESTVRKFDGSTGQLIEVFVESGAGGLSCPVDVAFGPDGNLYVTDFDGDRVLRYDGSNGDFLDVFVAAGAGGLSGPFGMLFRSDGNLYVASIDTDEILRYNASSGAFVDVFVSSGSGGLDSPLMMTLFPAGELQFSLANFSVSEAEGSATIEVLRVDGSSGEVTVQFNTSDGSAVAGVDYTAVSETLVFAEGETSRSVSIPILQNESDAADKTVNLTLSNPTDDAVLGAPASATLTIEDDDIDGGGGCSLARASSKPWGIWMMALSLFLLPVARRVSMHSAQHEQ